MQALKGKVFCLDDNTYKYEGTFGGVFRGLTYVMLGGDFASASVTERHQSGI